MTKRSVIILVVQGTPHEANLTRAGQRGQVLCQYQILWADMTRTPGPRGKAGPCSRACTHSSGQDQVDADMGDPDDGAGGTEADAGQLESESG